MLYIYHRTRIHLKDAEYVRFYMYFVVLRFLPVPS